MHAVLYREGVAVPAMADTNKMDFPKISFSEALEIAEKVKSKNIKTLPSLQGELGYSPKSHGGSFFYKWAALSKYYGIMEPSRANLAFTRLGERIITPLGDADRAAAIRDSLSRIPLLQSLYDSLGANYHQDDFNIKLSALTGATPAEVTSVSKRMEEIYKDAVRFMIPGTRNIPPAPMMESQGGSGERRSPQPDADSAHLGSVGAPRFDGPVRTLHSEDGYFIRVILSEGAIQEAIDVLEALKKRATFKARSAQRVLADPTT